jgi:RNA polymerase sigma factor (sigma-70 family)
MPGNKPITDAYLSCRSYLARAVSRIVPPHEIEDIVQETYVRVCQFKPKEEIKAPRALMVRIARNLALDHIKRAEWRLTSRIDEDSVMEAGKAARLADETFNRVTSDEEFAQFCEAVRELPQQCRRVFVLKKVYGHSQREIARELDISQSTVEKHIAKGMKQCVYHMLQHAGNDMSSTPVLKQAVSEKGGRQ